MGGRPRIITLTTDFGRADTFVGEMKGAILSVAPEATVVDLSHDVPAHDIAAGAFALDVGSRPFPDDAVHVAVIDPGVGTARRAVAVETTTGVFVGPDNGVLGRALARGRIVRAHAIDRDEFRRPAVGATFEGRDRFAPAAAWIARGTPIERLGDAVSDPVVATRPPRLVRGGETVTAAVAHVDRFGNVFLDVMLGDLVPPGRKDAGVEPFVRLADGREIARLLRAYGDAADDDPFLLINSADLLEIAVRESRADTAVGLRRGDRVLVGLRTRGRGDAGVL